MMLMIYCIGLVQGVLGENYFVWEVVVGNGVDVCDFVYVDVYMGKIIDKIVGIYEVKNCCVFDGVGVVNVFGFNYLQNLFWFEG